MNLTVTDQLQSVLQSLNPTQRQAAAHGEGSMLVLAGPGSGKTRVLTARVARLIQETPSERFKVLALTFTNKAAGEMLERIRELNDGDETGRALVGTFHAFCIEALQSHGSLTGWGAGFTIYGLPADRMAIAREAIQRAGVGGHYDENRFLNAIDRLRSRLILPEDAAKHFRDAGQGEAVSKVYAAYTDALREAQALDFDGLLFETWLLFKQNPAMAERYRNTYRFWLIDEFQDTNRAQYGLMKELAGSEFKNVFAVADDDQLIYRWNGASYQQLQLFQRDYEPQLVQLPTNYRCPEPVVAAANSLIAHNVERTPSKLPLIAGKASKNGGNAQVIEVLKTATDEDERRLVSEKILALTPAEREGTVVLARTKNLLTAVQAELEKHSVKAVIVARRDAFSSAGYSWMEAVLRQLTRPQDERNLGVISGAFERLGGKQASVENLVDQSETTGKSLLASWIDAMGTSETLGRLLDLSRRLVERPHEWRSFCRSCGEFWKQHFPDGEPLDFVEDAQAWAEIVREINLGIGRDASLDEFMHRLDITSKEPTPPSDAVRLMTIHGAKGKEFETVFLMGLAEGELPSWQSLKPEAAEAEVEEERRNCFVAITRTEERLYLSYAAKYRGYQRQPSRFLSEMGLYEA